MTQNVAYLRKRCAATHHVGREAVPEDWEPTYRVGGFSFVFSKAFFRTSLMT